MADPWKKHPSGISYRVDRRNDELLYLIQGADRWLKEEDFDLYCQKKSREIPRDHHRYETLPAATEHQDHQGPLRGPSQNDTRLFPVEGDLRESQGRESYEIRTRDARPPPKQYASTRRGSAYESDRGTTSTLISRTRSADAGISSQSTSRMVNSADQSERPLPAQKPQLSSLARSFASLGLNEYSNSSRFISDNPNIIAKSEIDALTTHALFAEKGGQSTTAWTCIHQALLLKACKDASSNGINSFFRDLAARDGRAKDTLMKNVQKVYGSIQEQGIRTGQQSQGPDSLESTQKPQLSSLARSFASLGLGEYSKSSHFISDNPNIIAKSEIDALIAYASFLISNASSAEKAEQSTIARTCIHQALLLKACKDASSNGINSFFQDLAAKDGRAKDALMKDVQKVYGSIQEQGIRTGQQSQGPDSEPRDRKPPVVLQTTERTVSQNPYAPAPRPSEATQSQTPVIRDREGRPFYTDNQGNVLRPASSRHDPDCHRPVEKMASVSIGKESQSGARGDGRNAPGRASHRTSVSGPPEPLSTFPEHGRLEDRGDGRNAPGRTFHRTSLSGPPEPLPTLPEHGKLEYTKIGGTAGSVEKLDLRYRVRKDAKKFFECGRVFALLWHESAGEGGDNRNHTELSDPVSMKGRFGQKVYSHIRRMAVVKENHGFCLCVPINTYNSQGVTKHGLSEEDKRAHSIVYMSGTRPSCLPEEERDLTKKPIAVEKASDDQKLDIMSRLNFKKIYTIEHNVKVMNVGKVTRDSLPVFLKYWKQSLDD